MSSANVPSQDVQRTASAGAVNSADVPCQDVQTTASAGEANPPEFTMDMFDVDASYCGQLDEGSGSRVPVASAAPGLAQQSSMLSLGTEMTPTVDGQALPTGGHGGAARPPAAHARPHRAPARSTLSTTDDDLTLATDGATQPAQTTSAQSLVWVHGTPHGEAPAQGDDLAAAEGAIPMSASRSPFGVPERSSAPSGAGRDSSRTPMARSHRALRDVLATLLEEVTEDTPLVLGDSTQLRKAAGLISARIGLDALGVASLEGLIQAEDASHSASTAGADSEAASTHGAPGKQAGGFHVSPQGGKARRAVPFVWGLDASSEMPLAQLRQQCRSASLLPASHQGTGIRALSGLQRGAATVQPVRAGAAAPLPSRAPLRLPSGTKLLQACLSHSVGLLGRHQHAELGAHAGASVASGVSLSGAVLQEARVGASVGACASVGGPGPLLAPRRVAALAALSPLRTGGARPRLELAAGRGAPLLRGLLAPPGRRLAQGLAPPSARGEPGRGCLALSRTLSARQGAVQLMASNVLRLKRLSLGGTIALRGGPMQQGPGGGLIRRSIVPPRQVRRPNEPASRSPLASPRGAQVQRPGLSIGPSDSPVRSAAPRLRVLPQPGQPTSGADARADPAASPRQGLVAANPRGAGLHITAALAAARWDESVGKISCQGRVQARRQAFEHAFGQLLQSGSSGVAVPAGGAGAGGSDLQQQEGVSSSIPPGPAAGSIAGAGRRRWSSRTSLAGLPPRPASEGSASSADDS